MRKIISTMLIITILTGLFSACSQKNNTQIEPPSTMGEVPSTESSTEGNAGTISASEDVTFAGILAALNKLFAGSAFGAITDIKESPDSDGSVAYTFLLADGLAMCAVREVNQKVQSVTTIVSVQDLYYKLSSMSQEDQLGYGLMLCALPIQSVNFPNENTNYLPSLLLKAAKSDTNGVNGVCTIREWEYSLYCSDVILRIGATNLDIKDSVHNEKVEDNSSNNSGTQIGDSTSQPPATQPPATQPPATCSHNYAAATCAKPQTCTICGLTKGYPTYDHTWEFTSCNAPYACSGCGEKLVSGDVPGHSWKKGTCTEPERCTVCGETGAAARGHWMRFTKCLDCDYIDYSCIADTYTNVKVDAYLVGTTTWVDVEVTNVSISQSGMLSFTFNGKNYELTVKQNEKSQDDMGYFSCYMDGVLVEGVDFRAGSQSYYNAIYLDDFVADGYRLNIYATR